MERFKRCVKTLALWIGTMILLSATAFAVAVALPLEEPVAARATGTVAITNVSVVDIRNGRNIPGQAVVLADGRIAAVGPVGSVSVPEQARVIDGTGKYVMPSLWDMHAHVHAISPLLDLSLYIAYGVTNVRDMQGCPSKDDPFIACYQDKQRWTREALAGERVAPRIVEASSFMANGPGMARRLGNVPDYFDVATPDQARQFVRHYAGHADSIKVYDGLPRDAYLALADEASRLGLAVVGHKPRAVSALEAAKHQRSIEHARFLLHESFDGAEALRSKAGTPAWKEDRRGMVDRHDPAMASHIFAAMKANDVYYVPTHLTRWSDAYADDSWVREDPALEYLHPLMKMQWLEDVNAVVDRDPGPDARKSYRDFYALGLSLTRQAHSAGVRIMVGSDYIVPGLDVHRELQELVKAGLTPREALAAATIIPAEYAIATERYGDVSAGKVADLLLLDADPLVDIRNTRSIDTVVFNGAIYDHDAIAAIKRQVKANARSWSIGAKIIWRFIRHPANY